jgi:phosphoribosylformylglycinamidine (FGAM) synthase PurS component
VTADALIEVTYKKDAVDPVAHGLAQTLRHWEGPAPRRISTAQLYRLEGRLSSDDRARIARDLLCDPVIQEYRIQNASVFSLDKDGKKSAAALSVDIWYKAGVTDVASMSVLKGIRDLAIDGATDVRTGMRYRFWGLKNKEAARQVAVAFLANPLVQDILIHADH